MAINLTVVTADKTVFTESVDMVIAPGGDGQLGILPHHIPILTTLKPGDIRVRQGAVWTALPIAGGFMQVDARGVVILAD